MLVIGLLFALFLYFFPFNVTADEAHLSTITAEESKIVVPAKQKEQSVYSGYEVTKQGMDFSSDQAQTSVYDAINILPDVSAENPDNTGLYAEGTNIRIRGVRGYLGSMSVEGVPNYGGNPMGPRDYIYNMQNFKAIKVYESAVPASLGTGVGNRGGAIELVPLWSLKKTQFTTTQTFGSHELYTNFFRFDSGEIPNTKTSFSASYAYGIANKWRGPGEIGPRNNASFMLTQPIADIADIKLFFNYNALRQDLYRALSYNQIGNIYTDFNSSKTGTASKDIYYYGYNHGDFENTDALSIITIKPTQYFDLVLKPYYSKENTHIWQGVSPQNMIQKRTRDIERKGLIAQADLNFEHVKVSAGNQYEVSNMNIYSQNYAILGYNLAYRGYGVFATTGDTYLNSPFLQVATTFGPLNAQAGLKYFRFKDSPSQGYVTNPQPPYNLVRAPDLDRNGRVYDIWLPNAGVSYKFSDYFELFANYGRSFIRPYAYMPLVNIYNANRAKFQNAHLTLNDLFNGYDIERSDNVDLGARIRGDWFDIDPTVFFSKSKNLLTTVYDPRVGLNYQQNIGKATGYGFEVMFNAYVNDYLTLFFNPSYTRLTYDNNITYGGATINCKDNQVVDVPKWLVKSGAIITYDKWQFMPSIVFVGNRYADAAHTQEVGSYATLNAKINYTLKKFYKSSNLELSLSFNNILNKKYIAVINAMDDTLSGQASFYPGEPFNTAFAATLTF